jgi:flagellar motor switch protein FliN/FliY
MEQRAAAQRSGGSALDQLFDFELPVSFSFGRKKLALKDVLKLTPSSVVELDRAPDDLVEVIVNDAVIAWGEVVSIDGQYGIRIRRIAPGGLRAPAMNSAQAPVVRALAEA